MIKANNMDNSSIDVDTAKLLLVLELDGFESFFVSFDSASSISNSLSWLVEYKRKD